MDIKNESLISTIFNDKNLNKDERYMLLALKHLDRDGSNIIKVALKELVDIFGISKTSKVQAILKALEAKGYIAIEKSIGKISSYSLIKEELILEKNDALSNDQIVASTEKVCRKSNDQIEPSTKEVSTKSNNQTAPSTQKVYRLSNDLMASKDQRELGKVRNNINNIYNNINNKLYINIFNTWNKININRESNINPKITDAINIASKLYSEDEIIKAIENYSKVYHGDYYYNYPWNIVGFLSRENGIKRFMDNGDIWLNYKGKYEESIYGPDFNVEKYID